jgi:hypothetical protein
VHVKYELGGVAVEVNPQLVGAEIVNPVIAYEFELGFAIVMLTCVVAPFERTLGAIEMVGWLAFAALTGATNGTRSSTPVSASKERSSPELNFL